MGSNAKALEPENAGVSQSLFQRGNIGTKEYPKIDISHGYSSLHKL